MKPIGRLKTPKMKYPQTNPSVGFATCQKANPCGFHETLQNETSRCFNKKIPKQNPQGHFAKSTKDETRRELATPKPKSDTGFATPKMKLEGGFANPLKTKPTKHLVDGFTTPPPPQSKSQTQKLQYGYTSIPAWGALVFKDVIDI